MIPMQRLINRTGSIPDGTGVPPGCLQKSLGDGCCDLEHDAIVSCPFFGAFAVVKVHWLCALDALTVTGLIATRTEDGLV